MGHHRLYPCMGMGTMWVEKYGPIPYLWLVPVELPAGLPRPLLYTTQDREKLTITMGGGDQQDFPSA